MKAIFNNFLKIHKILGNKFLVEMLLLIFFNFLAILLELLSFSIILPMITLLTQEDIGEKYQFFIPFIKIVGNPNKFLLLKYFLMFMIYLYILKNLFLAILNFWQYKFVNNVQVKISEKLLKVYLYQPYEFFFERNSTQLFKNVAHEVGNFEYFILQIFQLIAEIPIVLGFIFILFKVDTFGTLFLLISSIFAMALYFLFTNKFTKNIGNKRIEYFEKSSQYLMEGLSGIKEIKVLGVEKIFISNYKKYHIKFSKLNYYNSSMSNYPKLWLEITTITCISLYLIHTINLNSNLNNVLPFLSIFILSSFRIMPSFAKIASSLQNLSYRGSIINNIFNELKMNTNEGLEENPIRVHFNSEIKLKNVFFKYKTSDNSIFKSLDLVIRKNSSLGIIGQSGSGKSTLIDILIGLIKPNTGFVLVDEININSSNDVLLSWQKNIGYVPQTIYLTDDTLKSNIALGVLDEDIDEISLNNAIENSCLSELIKSLPDGLLTNVGERGIKLSGGQRQRIGIARALYRNPPILILDEATSALDSKTELNVMNNINSLGNKTLILIAHRVSTLNKCDQLVSIDSGILSIVK